MTEYEMKCLSFLVDERYHSPNQLALILYEYENYLYSYFTEKYKDRKLKVMDMTTLKFGKFVSVYSEFSMSEFYFKINVYSRTGTFHKARIKEFL